MTTPVFGEFPATFWIARKSERGFGLSIWRLLRRFCGFGGNGVCCRCLGRHRVGWGWITARLKLGCGWRGWT